MNFEFLFNYSKQVFSSQDSKFYIYTAFKFAAVPIISFALTYFSLTTILEMNYNFFVANGFLKDSEIFYDIIFQNVLGYLSYFALMSVAIFMLGLFISYLGLRAFDHIEKHTFEIREDIDHELKIGILSEQKLIYQVSRLFFSYIQFIAKNDERPSISLPRQLLNLKAPKTDKLFLFQYSAVIAIICMASSLLLYSFTNDLYQEVISVGLDHLPTNKIVSSYLDSQKSLYFNIFATGIICHLLAYFYIARKIIKTIDGVSFGFARDMVMIIKGKHHIRLKPRSSDPGQSFSLIINEILEELFPNPNTDNRSLEEAVDDTLEQLDSTPKSLSFDSIDELVSLDNTGDKQNYSTLERSESRVVSMLMRGEALTNIMDESTAPSISHLDIKKDKKTG